MIVSLLKQILLAAVGTIAFALLYAVPPKYWASCGIVGGLGWGVYKALAIYCSISLPLAVFAATVVVVLLSRFLSVLQKCPATVFITTGIFPLVPGVTTYWTSYYIVTSQQTAALESGILAVKFAVAIVLGIIIVYEIPNGFFHLKRHK